MFYLTYLHKVIRRKIVMFGYNNVVHNMNKLLSISLSFLTLFILNSCQTKYSNSELEKNFSKEQIKELKKLTEFFKKEVCLNSESVFGNCFRKINHDSLFINGVGIWNKIDFDKQKKMYEDINSSFEEIWLYCESTYYPEKTKAKSLCANTTGLYVKYLTDYGKTNPRIAKYVENILAAGIFSDLYLRHQEILNDNKSFDLNDPNIQLILAIHYLSVNDYAKRNAHLKKKKGSPKF